MRLLSILLLSTSLTMHSYAFNVYDAIVQAHENNPDILAEMKEYSAVQASEYIASALFLPNISLSQQMLYRKITRGPATDSKSQYNVHSLNIKQNIYAGGGHVAELQRAKSETKRSRYGFISRSAKLCEDVIRSYEDVQTNREKLQFSLENEKQALKNLEFAEIKFKYGDTTITDVYSSEASLAEARAQLETSKAELNASIANLEYFIGGKAPEIMAAVELHDDHIPHTLEEIKSIALKHNPDLLATMAGYDMAMHAVNAANSRLLPNVDVNFNVNRSSFTTQELQTISSPPDAQELNLVASIPLNFGAIPGVSRARYQAESAKYRTRDVQEKLAAQAIALWGQHQANKAKNNAAKESLSATEKALEAIREETKIGTRTFNDLLQMQNRFYQAKVNLRAVEGEYRKVIYQILRLMGKADHYTPNRMHKAHVATEE